jgi:hypothetical protein
MPPSPTVVPNWDLEQLEVIMERPEAWQLVVAGPGTGKSDLACQRVAYLVDDGVSPSRILVVSFTRTAVAELRDRIGSYAISANSARRVRISTIDSHAWSLRSGFDDEPFDAIFGNDSYEINIERLVELFRSKQPQLIEFVETLEHLIIDESQDVVGVRAQLIIEMLRALSPTCGVTILADPTQAIYGFTTEEDGTQCASSCLLESFESAGLRQMSLRKLDRIYRIQNPELLNLFHQTRKEVEGREAGKNHVDQVQETIRAACGHDIGAAPPEDIANLLSLASEGTTLVLFRRRADVLIASSYCSEANLDHRLRMSGTPTIVQPWLGWLFGEATHAIIDRNSFDSLWGRQAAIAAGPFEGYRRDNCWNVLHKIAAGHRPETLDLVQLRRVTARSRPPLELCLPDYGVRGPILGTIHASKGREADLVILMMPPFRSQNGDGQTPAAILEEGRVYYVGATRARKMLIAGTRTAAPVGYLNSKRIFRRLGEHRVQLEIGREGDIDPLAHLAWSSAPELQKALAGLAARTIKLEARAFPESGYAIKLIAGLKNESGITRYLEIGELSAQFKQDLWAVAGILDPEKRLKPPLTFSNVYLVGITTVALTDEQRGGLRASAGWSGFGLAPVVKGFPSLSFVFRRMRGGA